MLSPICVTTKEEVKLMDFKSKGTIPKPVPSLPSLSAIEILTQTQPHKT